MKDKEKLEELKKMYNKIEVPKDIDDILESSINRGKIQMKKQNSMSWFKKGLATVAAVFAVFTLTVNTVPSFAEAAGRIPALGKLVQVVQFNKGNAGGGKITDGSNVNLISLHKEEGKEHIVINFSQEEKAQDIAPNFNIKYAKTPYTMTFTINGVRKLDAEKDFGELKKSKYIKDVYRIITLDDSAVRFNVVFNQPVKYEVVEYKEPAQVVVTLSNGQEKDEPVYSVRSASYPMGEELGILEELIFNEDDRRFLKDDEGTFFIEIGCFDTEEEATEKLEEIKEALGQELRFYIEKRDSKTLPKVIK